LIRYLENPRASSSADHHLSKALKKHDPPDATIRLELLPFDAVFTLHGKRTFQKKEKIRTRYRCICLNTSRIYLVSANAPAVPL
jgi:SprT protein